MSTTAIRLMALRVFYERYRILIACNYNLLIAVYHKLDAFSLNKRDEFFFKFSSYSRTLILWMKDLGVFRFHF